MHYGQPLNQHGYVGAEKNRMLTPEQVLWAREEYYHNRVTVREMAKSFNMSVESVRKMLRGDTYSNVADALPRATGAAQQREIHDGGALQRLLAQQAEIDRGEPKIDEILPKVAPFDPAKAMEEVYGEKLSPTAKVEGMEEVRDADPFGEE